MIQKINSPVSVIMDFNHNQQKLRPMQIQWQGKDWRIEKMGLHHHYYQGKKMIHIFSVVANGMFFKLKLDTENLFWNLLEIADGESN
jgi:hypothetical protein